MTADFAPDYLCNEPKCPGRQTYEASRAEMAATIADLHQKIERAEWFLAKEGYHRCDIPACNCPYWHGSHAGRRLAEIHEALGPLTQGRTSLLAVEKLIDAVRILRTNAAVIPDPRMDRATDCYAVSIDDIDALTALFLGE